MTGLEHYREAQRLLGLASESANIPFAQHEAFVSEAQVHATLALAAATVMASFPTGTTDRVAGIEPWREVLP